MAVSTEVGPALCSSVGSEPDEGTVLFAQAFFLLYNPACLFLTGRNVTQRQRRKKEQTVRRFR
jgi:hypothetical protein